MCGLVANHLGISLPSPTAPCLCSTSFLGIELHKMVARAALIGLEWLCLSHSSPYRQLVLPMLFAPSPNQCYCLLASVLASAPRSFRMCATNLRWRVYREQRLPFCSHYYQRPQRSLASSCCGKSQHWQNFLASY